MSFDRKAYMKEWHRLHPYDPAKAMDKHRAREYGLGTEAFKDILELQGNACAICRSLDPGVKNRTFSIDHDHVTGKVRGVLCRNCNQALGCAKDSPDLLRKMAQYLEDHTNE